MFSFRLRRDPAPLNADLHSHSTVSDGTIGPAELARRAHEKGVQLNVMNDELIVEMDKEEQRVKVKSKKPPWVNMPWEVKAWEPKITKDNK